MPSAIDLALVDGDVITYLAGFGAERVVYNLFLSDEEQEAGQPAFTSNYIGEVKAFAKDLDEYTISRTVEEDPMEYALHKAKLILEKVAAHTACEDMQVFLSGGDNFRDDIATYRKYKGNRDHTKKPGWYHSIREYMVKHWNASLVTGQEADDELGIRSTSLQKLGSTPVICSTDKDLLTIPGLHYNLSKEEIVSISPDEAEKRFYIQVLTGDSTDNIVGCPGVGVKTAEKFLDMSAPWESVVSIYGQYLSKKTPEGMKMENDTLTYPHWDTGEQVVKTVEQFALEQAQLVYIRTNPEEVWRPNNV